MSQLEQTLAYQLDASGIEYAREFKFHASRKWRADFLVVTARVRVLIECEGLTRYGRNRNGSMRLGRHQTYKGAMADLEKYNAASELGYLVLRYSKEHIDDGRAIAQIERVIGHEPVDTIRRAGL